MCLAVPARVLEIYDGNQTLMGKVDLGGIRKEVCLELVPEVKVNQYVLIHVGFAISILNEEEAQETLKLLNELGKAAEEETPRNE